PPWCPGCGGDIRPESLGQKSASSPPLQEPESSGPELQEGMPPDTAVMDDGSICPACLLALAKPEGHEDCIFSCPDCGQCLRVPASWTSAVPVSTRKLGGSAIPAREKMPGWCSLLVGSLFAVPLWLVPDVSLFARLALTMLGSAILAEGVGRLRVEA